ncbi:MAG: hypothetical protein AAFU79_04005 [Myxococcota bacterium]
MPGIQDTPWFELMVRPDVLPLILMVATLIWFGAASLRGARTAKVRSSSTDRRR